MGTKSRSLTAREQLSAVRNPFLANSQKSCGKINSPTPGPLLDRIACPMSPQRSEPSPRQIWRKNRRPSDELRMIIINKNL